ncbi:MAG TPA: efflux RND transporter periplasmic adaptor subunit [Caldimonas sp.]
MLVLLVVAFQSLRGAAPTERQRTSTEPAATAVSIAIAAQRDLPIFLKASGRAEAKASVTVKSRLDGQVAAILFKEGAPVRRGQVLLRMDSASAEAQLRQAEALIGRDQAQVDRLAGESKRNTALFNQGFISQNGLGQTQADLQAGKATLRADQASRDAARLQLGFTAVVAPLDGVAGAALLPVGGAAKANDTALVVVNQVRPIYVTFALPESELERVKGALAHATVPVYASVPGSTSSSSGQLAFLDNAVDPSTGTILAKATFPNDDGRLTPGQFAEVKIPIERLPAAVVVPVAAIESGVDGPFVFVVKADSTVEIRPVRVAAESEGWSAVTRGLRAGEKVVTDGQPHLRAGSRVATGASAPLRLP